MYSNARFETFTPTKIQVEDFLIATPCSVVERYWHFRGSCCFRLHHKMSHHRWPRF